MTNQAARGRSREYLVRDYLCGTPEESKAKRRFPGFGWMPLQRSAASKGAVDHSFVKPGRLLLVQVKWDEPQVSPAERAALIHLADTIGITMTLPVTCSWPKRASVPSFRLLTGPGPKDWAVWLPDQDVISYQRPNDRVVLDIPRPRTYVGASLEAIP